MRGGIMKKNKKEYSALIEEYFDDLHSLFSFYINAYPGRDFIKSSVKQIKNGVKFLTPQNDYDKLTKFDVLVDISERRGIEFIESFIDAYEKSRNSFLDKYSIKTYKSCEE